MSLSHEKLVYLCDLAIEKGALGAKFTGGGMGGFIITLTQGKADSKRAFAYVKQGLFLRKPSRITALWEVDYQTDLGAVPDTQVDTG